MDNPHLSRLKNRSPDDPDGLLGEGQLTPIEDQAYAVDGILRAVVCTTVAPDHVPDGVAALVEASIADSTRRAYCSDIAHLTAWGGLLPAEPALVTSYIAAHTETLSVATLVRRIATILKAHDARGLRSASGATPSSRAGSKPRPTRLADIKGASHN